MLVYGFIYGLVGFLVTALPPEPWLWPLVLVALGLHLGALSLTLAGSAPGGWATRLGTGILQLLAALGLTLPLAVALNYLGSDQLDDITVNIVARQVILLSLGAAVLALLCRWITHHLSAQLLKRLPPRQMRGVLALVGGLGLALGGAVGLVLP